ncbi:hypothetical protein LOZ57_004464 [Ophidiomyces ophidiicola]|uniref:uncharacterized protein n=1 Tax=Ophidiomyces ophidiicola TaxID=1387563 RepID=UPI0020C27AF2|nr:uncharacterized protein LOZ57_004464 [Ophidiomyces ophidiicola]KAI1945166.1 hypothetical protein LOZ57_004464 [Ophidiomyces ophidiicola]KAI2051438.1 hypothetical protein LOZ43_004743 [Ophidiomyces ophidiicola]
MSLNGLDDPPIIDAYQSALSEPGGWFLLKYVSRDVIALLARGSGGVAEIRITIDSYEEKSPLYGFLQYRRRKVILRYVPDGISRILQARISVQFQSVLDKFSPHDTVFSLAVSSELTENALSSACLLHAATRSMTSSSNSIRRCQLGEITEDAEVEDSASIADQSVSGTLDVSSRRESMYSRLSEATAVPDDYKPGRSRVGSVADTASIRSKDFTDPSRHEKPLPSVPQEYAHVNGGSAQNHLIEPSEPRNSTQSSRPSTRDLDQASLHRPKVKLGPRPSVDVNGRPRTAGSIGRSRERRPVAALPAGVRLTTRKTNALRPKSQPNLDLPALPAAAAPPVPALLPPPPPLVGSFARNPPASPRSIRSMASSIGVTPEKQRLMRALELRKKQMEKQARQAAEKVIKQEQKVPLPEVEEEQEESGTVLDKTDASEEVEKVPAAVATAPAPAQTDPTSIVTNGVKPPAADQSKPDSAVDLSINEIPQADVSVPSVILDCKEESPLPDPSSDVVPASDADSVKPEVEDQETPVSSSINGDTEEDTSDKLDAPSKLETPIPSIEQADIQPCDIEIPSELERPDTPTPRAADFLQDVKDEPESNRLSEKQEDAVAQQKPVPELNVTSDIESVPEQVLSSDDASAPKQNRKEKRRAMLEPIRIPQRTDDLDDDNLLSDDSLMEELKSATLQEAKPVAVPKTPLSALSTNGDDRWKSPRLVSNPSPSSGSDVQALPVGRSVSATYYDGQAVPVLVAKKVNVSSGISKRIKALEMFSSRESSPSNVPVLPAPTTSSTSPFEKFRKRTAAAAPASTLSTSSTPSKSSKPPAAPPPAAVVVPDKPAQVLQQRRDSLSTVSSMKNKTNSVCVTARIIRDVSVPPADPSADPSEPSVLNLQRSQLTVEHEGSNEERARPSTPPPPPTSPAPAPKQERKRWSISSIGSKHVPDAAQVRRSDSTASKPSTSSRSKYDGPLSRSSMDTHSHLDIVDEAQEDKKESRKSRLMHRISTITTNSRRGIINALSPTVREEDPPTPPPKEDAPPSHHHHHHLPSPLSPAPPASAPASAPPQTVDIGEVNVQFPDTLLWKRRFLRLDDHGYLTLTPGTLDGSARHNNNNNNNTAVKRYHLSEFRTPSLPDLDRQELPNSIVLDFKNGSTLQCACESRQGQRAVLQTLLEAHSSNWHR